jgi:hypothetical protein
MTPKDEPCLIVVAAPSRPVSLIVAKRTSVKAAGDSTLGLQLEPPLKYRNQHTTVGCCGFYRSHFQMTLLRWWPCGQCSDA